MPNTPNTRTAEPKTKTPPFRDWPFPRRFAMSATHTGHVWKRPPCIALPVKKGAAA
ncbi:hypothetical protein SAMN06297251_12312 [Fulvimarina manganoxydans]|uniref:Uncharacterized protein n=1 Tax=Fulvimarina manganoxydans TaxID=937218 RepID=A0A1W2E9W0_9HYPH|nr:hypothetical protein SAMN06297251_12312 [Fulvimarina manganoxydans]